MPRTSQWVSERFENLIERAQEQKHLLDFDILIIGSGYGGAIAANTFAGRYHDGQALRIGVIERGDEYLAGMFPKNLSELPGHVRGLADASRFGQSHGLFDLRINGHINVLTGNGIGGGSLINAGVMAKPLAEVFDQRWPNALRAGSTLDFQRARSLVGAASINDSSLANTVSASGQTPEKYLSLQALAPSACSEAAITSAMQEGKNQAGVHMKACNHCGDCVTGCNQGAKNSLDLNLLVQAKRQGVEIYAGVSVAKIERDEESHYDWILHSHLTHDKLRQGQKEAIYLRAKKIVLAAGSLGSTEILMRSASEKLKFSEKLGQGFSGNGDAIAVGFKQNRSSQAIAWPDIKPCDRKVGPTITGIVDLRKSAGVLIEDMAVPNALSQFFSDIYTTCDGLHTLGTFSFEHHKKGPIIDDPLSLNRAALNHTSLYAIMGEDDADGQLELKSSKAKLFTEGELQIHWPNVQNKPIFNHQIDTLKNLINTTVEGRVLTNPTWSPLPPELTELYGAPKGPLLTVHPLGGCGMADNIERGVVDDMGQVFNGADNGGVHTGLIVLDGSIIPTALGINPALTISALALRASEKLCEQWSYSRNQISYLDISDTFTHRPVWRDINNHYSSTKTKIEVNERLSGEIKLKTSRGDKNFIAELTLKFKPKAITDYINTDGMGSFQNRISEVNDKDEAGTPFSHFRLFEPDIWHQLTASRADEPAFDAAAIMTAPISGQLEIMQREPLSAAQRHWRGLKAWALNRGIRDILQSARTENSSTSRMGVVDKAINLFKLAGHAGEARLFEYNLVLHKPTAGWPKLLCSFKSDNESYFFVGKKTITYARRSNPIRQFSEIAISTFPGLTSDVKHNRLSFDNRNIVRNNHPLLRITEHQDLVQSFTDLCSFYAYFARLLISTHLLTFRQPDAQKPRQPKRFAGRLAGLPTPEIVELRVATLDNGLPIYVRLTRYRNDTNTEPPLVMLHGYSASSTTWAHPAIPNCAAVYFHRRGRDIWLVDLRTSCGYLTAMLPWQFEDVAFQDIPLALNHILHKTNNAQCDIIAHCMGAAMLSMAILKSPQPGDAYFKERKQLPNIIRNLVITQVGPKVSFSPMNMTRGYLLKNTRHLLGNLPFKFRPNDAPSTLESLFDRLLQALPYPEHEFSRENPAFSGKFVRWSATRRRIDALYGQAFSLSNMSDELLTYIDDIFGPLSMGTLSQTIHFALQEQITNFDGENIYATADNFRDRWCFNTLSVHGGKSGLADIGTATLLNQAMAQAPGSYQQHIFPNFGHQDLLIGKGCAEVFDRINRFFCTAKINEETGVEQAPAPIPQFAFCLPTLGPVVGPAHQTHLPVMLGTAISAERPDWILFIEVNDAGEPLAELSDAIASGGACQHFHLQSTRLMQHQWLKLTLENRATPQRKGIWQSYFIYDHKNAAEHLPLSTPHPNNLIDLLQNTSTPYQEITAGYLRKLFADEELLAAYKYAIGQDNQIKQRGQIQWRPFSADHFSFVVGACQFPALLTDHEPAFSSFRRLAQRLRQSDAPELMLLLGDQVYVDPTAGVIDAQAYHHRYVEPYQTWLAQPEVADVLRQLPSYMMPDDHEIANDWDLNAGRDRNFSHARPGRDSYLRFQRHTVFQPHHRHLNTRQAVFAQLPLWQQAEHAGIHFFLADARTERSGRSAFDTNSKIIGAQQYCELTQWLKRTPKDSPKVVSTGSMLLPRRLRSTTGVGASALSDAWDGYAKQMFKLLNFIAQERIENLIFISGDEHISCHAQLEIQHPDGTQIVHSIHSSGLYSPLPFVNSIAEDFAEHDQFVLDSSSDSLKAAVNARFFPGDGFAELQFIKEGNQWLMLCNFNRATGDIQLKLNLSAPMAAIDKSTTRTSS